MTGIETEQKNDTSKGAADTDSQPEPTCGMEQMKEMMGGCCSGMMGRMMGACAPPARTGDAPESGEENQGREREGGG